MRPQVRARLEAGFAVPAPAYVEALAMRGPSLERFCATSLADVDCLVLPVMPMRTPSIAETDVGGGPGMGKTIGDITRYLRGINYLGVPSLALPCGSDSRGMPIGMQLVGRPWSEKTLLCAGHAFQRERDFHRRGPVLA